MAYTEYFFLFQDSFLASLIMPIHREVVLYGMLDYGRTSRLLLLTVAVAASLLGSVGNYFLGVVLCGLRKIKPREAQDRWFVRSYYKMQPFFPVLILATGFTSVFGKVFIVLLGYFRYDWRLAFCSLLSARMLYYIARLLLHAGV